MSHQRKRSSYDWDPAKDALGLGKTAHNRQVCSANAALSCTAVETPTTVLVINPTKEDVREERDMLYSIASEFEHKFESSNWKIESLKSKSRELAKSQMTEKSGSQSVMEKDDDTDGGTHPLLSGKVPETKVTSR